MHLADAFIQSNLQCIQALHILSACEFWQKILLCALYLTHPSALTVLHTHLEQWAAIAAVPGSFVALLKALTSVMVSKVVHSPPTTIPAGPEIRTHDLRLQVRHSIH